MEDVRCAAASVQGGAMCTAGFIWGSGRHAGSRVNGNLMGNIGMDIGWRAAPFEASAALGRSAPRLAKVRPRMQRPITDDVLYVQKFSCSAREERRGQTSDVS